MSLSILHVIHSVDASGGGPVEVIKQMSRLHCEAGHSVEVLSLDAPASQCVRDFPLPIHPMRERPPKKRNDYGFTPALVSWLKQNAGKYNAVISHGLWQYHNFGVWRALHNSPTPYLVYPHGMLDPWFRQYYPLKHLKKWIYWQSIEHRVIRDARCLVFTSEEEQRLAHETFTFDPCRDLVVRYGTAEPPAEDLQQRAAFFKQYPHLEGKRLLLFLGRLHPKKGCEMLLEAFARLSNGSHLVLAGPCHDPHYLRTLKTMAERMCPVGTVTFTGMLTGDLKWGAFRASEAFILPSHQENFGVSVVEALSCGLPVLISNRVNIWREIEHAGAGLIATDDLAGTTSLLERWNSLSSDQRGTMRSAAHVCFSEQFDVRLAAEQILEIIKNPSGNRHATAI